MSSRYEVGMSTHFLNAGYKIYIPAVNQCGFGKSLVYDTDGIWGIDIDDTISNIWQEDGIRNLTVTKSKQTPKWWIKHLKTETRFQGATILQVR